MFANIIYVNTLALLLSIVMIPVINFIVEKKWKRQIFYVLNIILLLLILIPFMYTIIPCLLYLFLGGYVIALNLIAISLCIYLIMFFQNILRQGSKRRKFYLFQYGLIITLFLILVSSCLFRWVFGV